MHRPRRQEWVVVIADVVGSRSRAGDQRHDLQESMLGLVDWVNTTLGAALGAPAALSRGDEIQCLVREPTVLPELLWELDVREADLAFRVGIGHGGLTTPLHENVLALDGPAFHLAREALTRAEDAKSFGGVFAGFGQEKDVVLNGLARLLSRHRRGLSRRAREVFSLLRKGQSQRLVGERLSMSKQLVSKYVSTGGWKTYAEGERALESALRMPG